MTGPRVAIYMELAAAEADRGRESDARSNMRIVRDGAKDELTPFPEDDPEAWRRYFERTHARRRKEDFEHMIEGARRAGLPV